MDTPRTKAEWQDAADAARGALLLDSARQYGLVVGGPMINVARCEQLLAGAKKRGIVPNEQRALDVVLRGGL